MYLQLWAFLRIPSDLPFLRIRRNKIFYARAPDLGQLMCMDTGTVARLTASHHPIGPEKVLGSGKNSNSEPQANLFGQVPFPKFFRKCGQ